jgi:hypothetical protein
MLKVRSLIPSPLLKQLANRHSIFPIPLRQGVSLLSIRLIKPSHVPQYLYRNQPFHYQKNETDHYSRYQQVKILNVFLLAQICQVVLYGRTFGLTRVPILKAMLRRIKNSLSFKVALDYIIDLPLPCSSKEQYQVR